MTYQEKWELSLPPDVLSLSSPCLPRNFLFGKKERERGREKERE